MDLVHELPLVKTNSFECTDGTAAGEDEEDPFCAFWQGDDSRLHAELCTVLDEAGIAHKTVRRQDRLFNLNNYPAFQMGVPFSQFERAEAAVKDAYGMPGSSADPVPSLNPPALIPDRSRPIRKLPEPPLVAEQAERKPQDEEVVVWSGEDPSLGDMLVASLHENQIDVRRENSHSKQSLLVSSQAEVRAREIVKEVVEGVPPEE